MSAPALNSSGSDIVTLPLRTAPGGGRGYHVVAAARGTGDRAVGTFSVAKNAKLFIQMSCDGPAPLTIRGILDTGPCRGGNAVTTYSITAAGSKLAIVVQASSKLAWAIYITQPEQRK
jgi:hypothetical protein